MSSASRDPAPARHDRTQLRLANACHPRMDPRERGRICRSVARAAGDWVWMGRLALLRARQGGDGGVDARLAMAMLDAYERHGSVTPGPARGGGSRPVVAAWLAALLLGLLCWWTTRKNHPDGRIR